jgi:hypothetical protein
MPNANDPILAATINAAIADELDRLADGCDLAADGLKPPRPAEKEIHRAHARHLRARTTELRASKARASQPELKAGVEVIVVEDNPDFVMDVTGGRAELLEVDPDSSTAPYLVRMVGSRIEHWVKNVRVSG